MSGQSVMPVVPSSIDAGTGLAPCEPGPGRGHPGHQVGLGALTCEISPDLVEEVIELTGCRENRQRLLPARVVVYFVLGLCLLLAAYLSAHKTMINGSALCTGLAVTERD